MMMFYRRTLLALCCLVAAAASGSAQSPAAPAADSVVLDFPNTDVREVLPLYESLTHFKIIRGYSVQGRISVAAAEPVTPEKAIELIEAALFARGFPIVQVTPDIVEISGPSRNPRSAGLPVISDPSQLPTHERVVSYLFQLKHADATDVSNLVAEALQPRNHKPTHNYASILAAKDSNKLWVTEATSVIRQLLTVIEKLDVPPAQQDQTSPR